MCLLDVMASFQVTWYAETDVGCLCGLYAQACGNTRVKVSCLYCVMHCSLRRLHKDCVTSASKLCCFCCLQGPGLNQVTRPVATKLQAVTKQINKMLKEPGSCQAVKHAKHKTLQQLLQAIQHSAAQKHPVLQHAGNTSTAINTSSSTIGRLSPFLTDIREQLSDSTVRDNQLEAFDAVRSYFTGSNSDRPAQHQLQQVTCATYNAFCELRSGVCDQILSLNGGSSSGRDPCSPDPGSRSSPDSQQQLDQCTRWLEAFAAAWKAEQEVLGEASDWNNVAAGVVEPTGEQSVLESIKWSQPLYILIETFISVM